MVVAQPELTGCECLCFRKLISKKARKLRAFFCLLFKINCYRESKDEFSPVNRVVWQSRNINSSRRLRGRPTYGISIPMPRSK